jgi:hypothetical protein
VLIVYHFVVYAAKQNEVIWFVEKLDLEAGVVPRSLALP